MGIMENKMETARFRVIYGLYRIYIGDNGKENGNYYNGLYRVHIGVIVG